jgi:hypothetical protein
MMTARSVVPFLLIAASPVLAQAGGRPIDEGTLIITRAGAPLGVETFRILAIGNDGSQLRAFGQRMIGDQRVVASLTTDSMGTPSAYELSIKEGKVEMLDVRAHASPGRLASMSRDQKRNESMKEWALAPAATVILDEDVYHQYALVAVHRRGGTVKVIVPRTGREYTEVLTPGGTESIDIGGRRLSATKYSLGSGRQFWTDSAGHLLRVTTADGVTATRDEPPR